MVASSARFSAMVELLSCMSRSISPLRAVASAAWPVAGRCRLATEVTARVPTPASKAIAVTTNAVIFRAIVHRRASSGNIRA